MTDIRIPNASPPPRMPIFVGKLDVSPLCRAQLWMKWLSRISLVMVWLISGIAIGLETWFVHKILNAADSYADITIGDIAVVALSAMLTVFYIAFAFAPRRLTLWLSLHVLKRMEQWAFKPSAKGGSGHQGGGGIHA